MRRTALLPVLVSDPARLVWAVRVRWLVIGGFLLLALAAHAFGLFRSLDACLAAAAVGAVMNGANDWAVRRGRWVAAITVIAIPLDHVLITYVVIETGGVHSPFIMMYVVQVLATAMLVETRVAAASALLALLCLFAGTRLHAAGILRGGGMFASAAFGPAAPSRSLVYQVTWAAFLLYCLGLLVYLGGYISDRLRASERDLADRNRRLQDALGSLHAAHAELSAAYDRLKQTEAHLIQSEKMRSLGELVAGVAHELNNPISFISGNVEHLRTTIERLTRVLQAYRDADVAAEDRRRLDALQRDVRLEPLLADLPALLADCEEGARRSKQIVNQLRAFSRSGEREAWQPTDVNTELQNTIAVLAHRLKGRITLHTDFGALPAVECLAAQLNQVFMNLLANAADAIGPRGGNIWVSTRADDGRVAISIRDDGAGISPEARQHLFEPFFTTKPQGQGVGLGLSVSYGIVQRHHGEIAATSTPAGGTTFTVTLPVRQGT